MKRRLFQINRPNGKRLVDDKSDYPVFFSSKPAAKKVRDALNRDSDGGYTVSYGPDHNKFKGENR